MKQTSATPALFALFIGLFLLIFNQTVTAQSALDGFDPNANSIVRDIVVQPDGKILVAGGFSFIAGTARNFIARLNPDGTIDTTFNPNANGLVRSIAVQSDGKVIAAGDFTNIGGQPRNRIARLDATTGASDSWNPNSNNTISVVTVQSDDKVLVGGSFTNIGGQARNRIARLDGTTGLADSFNPNASTSVFAIAVQTDGKVIAGGFFNTISGQPRNCLARLDAATGAADSFNPNTNSGCDIRAVAVQADGKILAGGFFTNIGGQARANIARLDMTGTADSFNPNSNDGVQSIKVQSDGKILAGGFFMTIGGQTRNRIARLDSITGLADSFDPNADNTIQVVAVQADGKILTGGLFVTVSPNGGGAVPRNRIARLERDGRLDRTLDIATIGTFVTATAIQPDGKILIGGLFSSVLGTPRNNIARLNLDGTLDTAFDPNANSTVHSIALQSDGKILLSGFFTSLSPNGGAAVTRNYIARVNADGTLDAAFDPNANIVVFSIAAQSDGKILLGGGFTSLSPNGGAAVTRNRIARVNADGTLDTTFNPNANIVIFSIALQSDGKILLGGGFTSLSPNGGATVSRNRIARVNTDGTLDAAFDPNANGSVYSIAVQTDGKILLGGEFTSLSPNGGAAVTRNRIARLNPDGTLDAAFDPNASGSVYSIAAQTDGRILLGGDFTNLSPNGGAAVSRSRIARVNADGTLDTTFDPNANNSVYSIAVQSDGKVLAGGALTTIGGQSRILFARLTNDTAALSTLSVTETTLTLTRDGSAPLFSRVIFEQSIDNGANWTLLGTATNSIASLISSGKGANPFAPNAAGYTLSGQTIPTGQNVLIRARGFYRSGYQSGSETIEDKVQIAYLFPALAANVSVSGRVLAASGAGLRNAVVTLTDTSGNSRNVITSAFGYYSFETVEAGQTYIISVSSKRFLFTPQVVSVNDNIADLDFTAQ